MCSIIFPGFRHPNQDTVSRTTRILSMLLDIVAKTPSAPGQPQQKDKFEVTPHNVAYLAALVSVSEEVRSRYNLLHQAVFMYFFRSQTQIYDHNTFLCFFLQ